MTIFSRARARQAGEERLGRIILPRRRTCVRACSASRISRCDRRGGRARQNGGEADERANGGHERRKEGENWRRRKEGVDPRTRTTSRTRGDFSSTLYPYPHPPSLLLLKDRGGGGDVGGRERERG